MNVTEFIRAHAVPEERFTRFNELDPEQMDYTIQIQKPTGDLVTLRNPSEATDGTLADKSHQIAPGSKLVAFGTAFWNWVAKLLNTIGIDIDTDDNHANGLATSEFGAALEAVKRVPWLEARRSSGGKGLHVFPRFTRPVEAATRADASALARAVLTLASREAKFDFKAAKDCAGTNMWIYKAGAPSSAYEVIKEATSALDPDDLPPGWREAKEASQRKVQFAPSTIPLSPEHLAIEKQLQSLGYSLIYVHDYGCYQIHTHALQQAHQQFGHRGHFTTVSKGTNPGQPNGYMFPLPGGAFLVKRFGNAKEDASWFNGPNGPYAFLNVEVPFQRAVQHFASNKTTKGYAYTRSNLDAMLKTIGVQLNIPKEFDGRTLFIKQVKEDVQISVDKQDADVHFPDWTPSGKTWQRSFAVPPMADAFEEAEVVHASVAVRAVSTDTESAKWCIKTDGVWTGTSASEVRNVVIAQGCNAPSVVMGRMRQQPHWLVFEPFQDEYLPGRRWNRDAPRLACRPADEPSDTPTWDAVFNHIGSGMDDDVANDEVCRSRGITTGGEYLRLWTKLLIEKPEQRTPYLALSSRQNNTGKTSLGASVRYLINPGVAEINEEALVDKFTGELEGKVLCLIEELDLRDQRKKAYTMLKRILTSKTLTIRKMRTDAYNVPNFTHFIHTANDANFVPVETEDMRIVMISVSPIQHFIESIEFENGIQRKAPSMLRKLLDMPLSEPYGRFWLPVVQTSLKESVLSGHYDTETSESEEGLASFATKQLILGRDAEAPQTEVLARYTEFCSTEKVLAVPKAGFMKVLRDKLGIPVDKKQKRIGAKRTWYYTGFTLKA